MYHRVCSPIPSERHASVQGGAMLPGSLAAYNVVVQCFGGTYAARDRALFLLGCYAGFRISELLALSCGDVEQHGHIVDVVMVRRRHMKGQRQARRVPLHPVCKDALATWLATFPHDHDTPVFKSRKGTKAIRQHAWAILQTVFDAFQ
ncbi:MAG: tyrosine-type recombinase/integrase, partial [Candidatus Tectomicrobia bacterium]